VNSVPINWQSLNGQLTTYILPYIGIPATPLH
jgi:hypothetical protein